MVRFGRVLAAVLLGALTGAWASPAGAEPGPGVPGPAGPVLAAAALAAPVPGSRAVGQPVWSGSWEAAPSGAAAVGAGVAIRNVVHLSVGGAALRIRLSNRLGTAPLRLGAVTVALRRTGPDAVPGTLRRAGFRGAPTATVPPGRDLLTDPVQLPVPAGADLLVTVFVPTDCGPATDHGTALQTSYLARSGTGHAADVNGTAYTATTRHWYYVTGVDVRGTALGSVVAFGDSLTDGTGSTPDTNHRWPDRLADRLRPRRIGVLNAGIGGNRLLRDDVGPSALARLDADALDRAGARVLIVWEGINDIIRGTAETPVADDFAAAYRTLVTRAHAAGLRVVGVTLTPYGGHPAHTPAREALRQRVNTLIRHGAIFDAVADADAAVRDPADPQRIRPAYDPGDHLHFDDAGMLAVARVVADALTGSR